RVLRDLDAELTRYLATGGEARLRPSHRAVYGYALARRAALGEGSRADVAGLLSGGGDSVRTRDLRHLGRVCLAIAADRPTEALHQLDAVPVSPEILGPPEPARLRSISYASAG